MRRVGLFLFLVGVIAACGKEEQEPSTTVTAREPAPYLVDADWLRRHRDDVVVVDMQSKRELYEKGHIPGAIHLEVNDLRTDEKLLKPRKELEKILGDLGIDEGTHLVAYDERHGRNAGWLWFTLNELGVPNVSLLDGHLMGFENELETGPGTKLAEKTFHARRDPPDIVDTAWVKSKLGQVVLIDARPVGQYTAEKPKKGMKGGHVPGAINVPWDTFVGPDGKYLDEVAAREKLAKLVDGEIWKGQTVVLYCNSHHAASHLQFQLARLGYGNLKAYDEGMKFWEKQELPLRGGSQP